MEVCLLILAAERRAVQHKRILATLTTHLVLWPVGVPSMINIRPSVSIDGAPRANYNTRKSVRFIPITHTASLDDNSPVHRPDPVCTYPVGISLITYLALDRDSFAVNSSRYIQHLHDIHLLYIMMPHPYPPSLVDFMSCIFQMGKTDITSLLAALTDVYAYIVPYMCALVPPYYFILLYTYRTERLLCHSSKIPHF